MFDGEKEARQLPVDVVYVMYKLPNLADENEAQDNLIEEQPHVAEDPCKHYRICKDQHNADDDLKRESSHGTNRYRLSAFIEIDHKPCFFILRYNAVLVIPNDRAVLLTLPSCSLRVC